MNERESQQITCDHNSLIRRQFMKIESLENQLALIKLERDSLIGENERLCFQLQVMSEAIKKQSYNQSKNDTNDGAISSIDSHLSYIDNNHNNNRQLIINNPNNYEISQQLLDCRVVALERKYGGNIARNAAIIIQKAFRTYRLKKRFQLIAIQVINNKQNQNKQKIIIENNIKRNSTISELNNDSNCFSSNGSSNSSSIISSPELECQRKRQYRVGLNLFNKHPSERGIQYLINNGFIETQNQQTTIESQALAVARFLLTRKGISKSMIGEYISTNHSFNSLVLKSFSKEIDLSGLTIDSGLRKFQTFFRFPGEAQKIERLVDCFANRFIDCNPNEVLSRDSVFILSFAIIMLNTDLHSKTLSSKSRMTSQQWIHNLRGVFSEGNLEDSYLLDIYQRIKNQEFRTGADHVTQVMKVQSAIVGKEVPNLCLNHRRLVCYCRLYEILDLNKKDINKHQREVFLFNDLLLITKLTSKAKSGQLAEYQFRSSLPLDGLSVQIFKTQFHLFGIKLFRKIDQKLIIQLNARNELDLNRFCDDLKESILEMNEMEILRITKSNSLLQLNSNNHNNNDHLLHNNNQNQNNLLEQESEQKNTTNIEINNKNSQIIRRKSSSGSLDSGLSLPSRDHSPQQQSGNGVKK